MVSMSEFAKTIMYRTYSHDINERKETWEEIARRVTKNVMQAVGITMREELARNIEEAIIDRKFIPGGRYLYAAGRPIHQVQNCLLLRCYDSREGWSELLYKGSSALMTGAGIGVDYSQVRHEGSLIRKIGGLATGPIAIMQMLNECGRGIMQGGSRRSALWAGLNWKHGDAYKFIYIKNWSDDVKTIKAKDFNFPAILDCTNISILLDDEFFEAYHNIDHVHHSLAHGIYWAAIEQMLKTGEPGFCVNVGKNAKETLRNACCEVTSEDSDDVCNLGSINIARTKSINEFKNIIELAVAFLLAGSVYSDVPYSDVDKIRSVNRRLGLGIMGIHEWLLERGHSYEKNNELASWLREYKESTKVAHKLADQWSLSRPIKTRAIAPNGTTSIIAETTGGIEPIFCAAYKRRYMKGGGWRYQYVIDPVAKRLIYHNGLEHTAVEDAYVLSRNVETRIAFQAWIQEYVDHSISSTINLPAYGTELNNADTMQDFGKILIKYLPRLRGITVYPENARAGQPITPVDFYDAILKVGTELIEEPTNVCNLKTGICGD